MVLVLTEGAAPLSFERDDFAGGMVCGNLVGSDEQAAIMGEHDGSALEGMSAEGGEVLDVFRPRE